jgi:hypothetical protein
VGGSVGQVLTKTGSGDYQTGWATSGASTPRAFGAATLAATSIANGGSGSRVTFATEQFNPASWFDPTNSRYTPQVAGYYAFSATVSNNGIGTAFYLNIRKNAATTLATASQPSPGAGAFMYVSTSAVCYLNGSTDYVEVWMQQYSGSSQNMGHIGYFSGFLVAAA